jgi:transcriptional/translational regulatory protein YebC/TACO1
MKSAYELAMERLEKEAPNRKLSEKTKAELAEITMRPLNECESCGDDAVRMQKLLDVLEDLDDVQDVFHNALISE